LCLFAAIPHSEFSSRAPLSPLTSIAFFTISFA
jgi:hypothetical protein